MIRTTSRTISALLLLLGCGTDSTAPAATATSGDTTVVEPDGTTTELDPEHPEPIDELAGALSDGHSRVDLGEPFARPEIGDVAGRRLVLDGTVIETWTFDGDPRAQAFAARFSTDGRLFDGETLPWTETTHVWTWGPMVMMVIGDEPGTLSDLDAIATRQTSHPDDEALVLGAAEVEARVRDAALDRFELGGQQPLILVEKERVVFGDACLDIEGAAEVCAEVETPGWRLTFAHGDDHLVAHTDTAVTRIFWRSEG